MWLREVNLNRTFYKTARKTFPAAFAWRELSLDYLSTEEGKRNLAEWTAERQLNSTETKKESR